VHNGLVRGKQRWLCPSCGKTFGLSGMPIKRERQKIWFDRWICEGYSMRQLVKQSGYSRSTIQRIISYWLSHSPNSVRELRAFKYLAVDGSYLLARKTAVVGIADPVARCLVEGRYGIKEGERRMYDWCLKLREEGLMPKSITIDGLRQVQTLLEAVWPGVTIQRCLVHIQRQGLAWCRRDPHKAAVKRLRRLFEIVTHINSIDKRDQFIRQWLEWEEHFGKPIDSRPGRGKVFSDVKRARSLLHYALPNMFHYLDDLQIPNNTNWLEGYFSRLKSRYRQHRGLSGKNRNNYFSWYFYLCKK
jgi:transposase-like protein